MANFQTLNILKNSSLKKYLLLRTTRNLRNEKESMKNQIMKDQNPNLNVIFVGIHTLQNVLWRSIQLYVNWNQSQKVIQALKNFVFNHTALEGYF